MRTEGWPEHLADAIETAQKKAFSYGNFDCCLFAADVVLAITGHDYAAELRSYQSKQSAYRIVARYGSLEAMISALLGKDPVHPAFAHRGDVVVGSVPVADGEAGESVGICCGVDCAFPASAGLAFYPRTTVRLAWRIE